MKSKLKILLLVFGLLLGISACGEEDTILGGVVPIYRGMSVSSQLISPTSDTTPGETDPIDPLFEEDLVDAFGIVTSEEIEYYALPESILYITINVYNPDQYEILSFSLNGKKYQSYQFEDGSDSENLILKVETGNISGIVEYTIDAIKYIDGTAINDVRMDGNQTVKVGVEHTNLPFTVVTNTILGSSSISFDVKVTDYAELIVASGSPAKIFLYDGLSIIDEQDLSVGVNAIIFDQLIPNTEYQFAVGAAYDKVDGLGTQVVVLHQEIFTTYEMVHIGDVVVTQDTIGFGIEIIDEGSVGSIQSIELYLNDLLISSKLVTDDLVFTALLSNATYDLKVTYTYNLGDGSGIQTKSQSLEITTLEKAIPELDVFDVTANSENVYFSVSSVDIDNVGHLTSIGLYQNEVLVYNVEDLIETNNLMISGLLSNQTYSIRVSYTYDLNDGTGSHVLVESYGITTQAKITPSLSFGTFETSIDNVTFDFSVVDHDMIGEVFEIGIYQNATKVQTLTDLAVLEFNNLLSDTEYTITILYQYDANDGLGNQIIEVSQTIYTAPYLGVVSTQVINTERLTEGDKVYLEITVDNPSAVTFTSVVINGDTHPVSDVTTSSYIRVEFLIDSTYTGGITSFVVEKINGYNHNQSRSFDITENNVGHAFVNGDVSIISIDILDTYGNQLDQAMPGDNFNIVIAFDNPTGYTIDRIQISFLGEIDSSQFTQNEAHTLLTIEQTSYYRNTIVEYNIESFTYSDENIESKTKNVDGYSDFIVCVTNSDYEYIYTANDLKNMQDGYAYKLGNDIDLTGIEWVPKEINFIVLDGNGYTISNLRIVKTYLDTHVRLGLFRSLNYSSVKNLTIDNFLFMVDLQRESTSSDYQSYAGLIAGSSHMTNFTNVNAYGEISVHNEVGTYNALGGLVGEAYRSTFSRVYTNVILSGDYAVGGLVGRAHEIQVDKSHTSGTIYGDRELGGIFGSTYNSKLTNVYSTMTIHLGEYQAGGLAGYGSTLYIKDSYYEGIIHLNDEWSEAGGLISYGENFTLINSFANATSQHGTPIPAYRYYWNNIIVDNVYALVANDSIEAKTAIEMYDIMSNVWDLSIWGFNGNAPVLKWTPSVRIINVVQGETVLTFEIATTDFDNVGAIDQIELYKGIELIESLSNLSLRRFEGLRYNTNYTIKVTYKFNYGDEIGDQFIFASQQVKTLPVSGTPEISFVEGDRSYDTLSFGYTVTDDLGIGSFESIEIFDDNGVLIKELLETDDMTFGELASDSLYKIVITFSYDLGDSFGVQYTTSINYMRTNPYVEMTETHVLNTDALFIGDILVVQINVNNPDNVIFTKAMINGQDYAIASTSLTRVRVDMMIDDNFIYGDVVLIVESLTGSFMGEVYTYALTENNTENVFINGEIVVDEINVYDFDDHEVIYLENGDSYILEIHFTNPTQYDINSITLNLRLHDWYQEERVYTDFEIDQDKQTIRIQLDVEESMYQRIRVISFNYSSAFLEASDKTVSGVETGFVIVVDDTVREIWTAEDLQNIESGYYYRMMADINLSGISWTPIDMFNGVLDGNGHVISNLSIVRSFTDENALVGLFKEIEYGVVKDLNIVDVSMVITTKSSSADNFEARVGALAGRINNESILSNIVVNGDIDVINQTNGSSYSGLLAGEIFASTLSRIFVSGTISGSNTTGGVTAILDRSHMENSYADVVMTTNGYDTGIFAGRAYDSWIKDSYARGTMINLQYSWGSGGFIGSVSDSILENIVSFTVNQDQNYIDPIPNGWNNIIKNSYALTYSNHLVQTNYTNAIAQMELVWDLSLWGFSQEYPMLKRTPHINITDVVSAIDGVTFSIVSTDYDQVGDIYTIELYRNGVLVESLEDLTLRTFTGLRYSSIYTIKVVYRYDYGDAFGEDFVETEYKFKTLDRENVPEINYKDIVITETSVTFGYDIIDLLEIGSLVSIELYNHEGVLIDTLDSQTLAFENLSTDSIYMIRINYTYDFNDEWGPNVLEAEYEVHTLALEIPTVNIISETSTVDSIGFALDIDDPLILGAITKVEVYQNNVFVKALSSYSQLQFTELYSNTWYQVRVTYTYDLNDQNGPQNFIITRDIYTQYLDAPWYYIQTEDVTTSTIGFDYYIHDPNDIGEITKVELYDGITKVATATDFENITFTGLYSNHQYIVKTTFTFDQNDGYGLRESSNQHYVNTQAYPNPSVNLTLIEITQNSLYYMGELDDPDHLGEITYMALFKDGVLLEASSLNVLDVTALDPGVTYELIVDYQYDLNDLGGLQVRQHIYEFETAPYANATQTTLLNTSAITIGDTLSLSVTTDNPDEVYFTQAIINGTLYDVSSYTISKIRIDMDVAEALGSGMTTITVEKLIGAYGDDTYTYVLFENNEIEVFINGDIYVESIDIVDDLDQTIDLASKNEDVVVHIKFYNPTGYDILSINIYTTHHGAQDYAYTQFTTNEDQTVVSLILPVGGDGHFEAIINNYTYDNENIDPNTKQVSGIFSRLVLLEDETVISIYDAADLQAMQSGYHYRLENDIDLIGFAWSPIMDFNGVLDGNGHMISNLTIISTYSDQSIKIGLFGSTNRAVIFDLNLIQINYIITLKTDSVNNYSAFVGGLIGFSGTGTKVTNVMVSGDISLNNKTSHDANVGHIAGYAESSEFRQIYTTGNLISNAYVGGLMGRVYSSILKDVYSSASFTSTSNNHGGGLMGQAGHITIENAYASGRNYQNNVDWGFAGIVGYIYQSSLKNVFSYVRNYAGDVIPTLRDGNDMNLTHVYSVADYYQHATVKPLQETIDLMASLWNLDIWSFGGDLPVIKRVPIVSVVDVVTNEYGFVFDIETTDYDNVGAIYAIDLYQDDTLIESLTELSLRSFDGLRYGTTYTLIVTYKYSYGDAVGDTYLEITKRVKTRDKENVPLIEVIDVTPTKDSITFDYTLEDPLSIGSDIVIKLYDAQYTLIEVLSGETMIFTNLKSDTTYVIQVNYTYDFDDGFGTNVAQGEYTVKTIAKITPSFEIDNASSTDQTIQFELDEIDLDGVGEVTSIALYQANTLIETLTDLDLRLFTGLEAYTDYTIVAIYTYDLADGTSARQMTRNLDIKTSPVIDITSTTLMNTEAIVTGDSVVLKLILNNPSAIVFEGAVVNGITYLVNQVNINELIIEIETDETFAGGNTTLTVTQLIGQLDDDQFTIAVSENHTAQAFINGDIYVSDLKATVGGAELDYLTYYGAFVLEVEFFNPTGYVIEEIVLYSEYIGESSYSGAQLTTNADYTILYINLTADTNNYYYSLQARQFTYSNDILSSRDRLASNQYTSFVLISGEDIIGITTPAELQAMTSGNSYQLMNNIDLSGVTWTPIENFNGYFDGNGYTISNLNITKTYEDKTAHVGLFASARGAVIKNLNMTNVSLIITITTYTAENYQTYMGGLIGRVENYVRISNVHVEGVFSVKNPTQGDVYFGGLVGYIGAYTKLENVSSAVHAQIVSGSWSSPSGGIVGEINHQTSIINAYSDATISGIRFVGGIVGRLHNSTIEKAHVDVDLYAYEYVGGIAGKMYQSTISHVYANGLVESRDYSSGGIAGYMERNDTILYAYANVEVSCINNWGLGAVVGMLRGEGSSALIDAYSTHLTMGSIGYFEIGTVTPSITYTIVNDGYSVVKSLAEIQELIELTWDTTIWDFDNLDAFGNPTFK